MQRELRAAATVAAAALVPRVWILLSTGDAGLWADMADYHQRALHLLEHGRLLPDTFRVPFYPLTLAGVYALAGPHLLAARVLQSVVLVGVAVATYALARAFTTRGRAMAAGLIVALYPGLLLYTVYLMAEPLFTLLMLLALVATRGRPTAATGVTAGVLAGLATLTRQAGVSVVVALAAWPFVRAMVEARDRRSTWRGVAVGACVVAGAALAIAPWAARNHVVFGRWMPLESTGGITFLMGQYEDATGRYLLSDWDAVHERYLGAYPEEFSRNVAAYRLGLQRIREDPGRILRLVPRRLGYLFDVEGREHLWLYTNAYFGPRPASTVLVIGWALALSFPLLAAAALASLTFGPPLQSSPERLVAWTLLVMVLQQITIYGDPRFHLPFVPLLALLAVRGWSWSSLRQASRWRVASGAGALAVGLAWWIARLGWHVRLVHLAAAPDGWQIALPY